VGGCATRIEELDMEREEDFVTSERGGETWGSLWGRVCEQMTGPDDSYVLIPVEGEPAA